MFFISWSLNLKMSLQWNILAGFLYSELAFTIFLLIPFISNRVWTALIKITIIRFAKRQFFCNLMMFFRKLGRFIKYYFYVVVFVMVLAFLDSIREMQKYADRESVNKEVKGKSELFYIHFFFISRLGRRLLTSKSSSKWNSLELREISTLLVLLCFCAWLSKNCLASFF